MEEGGGGRREGLRTDSAETSRVGANLVGLSNVEFFFLLSLLFSRLDINQASGVMEREREEREREGRRPPRSLIDIPAEESGIIKCQ